LRFELRFELKLRVDAREGNFVGLVTGGCTSERRRVNEVEGKSEK
jgi:hypothetical protein